MTTRTTATTTKDRLAMLERRLADSEATAAALRRELEATHREYEEHLLRLNQMVVDGELVQIELMQTFNTSADGMWVIDDRYRVQRVNDALLNLLKLAKTEVIGRQCYDLMAGSICRSAACPMAAVKRGRRRCECDMERAAPDGGDPRCWIISATPFLGLDGKMIGIVESVKDITPRKTAERALHEVNQLLARQATIDGLTGVANRRHFDTLLAMEWRRMSRDRAPLSLIMGDIDHFKAYNDTYGHLVGDDCIRRVAAAIGETLRRPGDLLARYGGEEFAVLLPNTPVDGVLHLAERIQHAIGRLDAPHRASPTAPRVTLSLGAATLTPAPGGDPKHLILTADTALYDAKRQGRNCVVFRTSPIA